MFWIKSHSSIFFMALTLFLVSINLKINASSNLDDPLNTTELGLSDQQPVQQDLLVLDPVIEMLGGVLSSSHAPIRDEFQFRGFREFISEMPSSISTPYYEAAYENHRLLVRHHLIPELESLNLQDNPWRSIILRPERTVEEQIAMSDEQAGVVFRFASQYGYDRAEDREREISFFHSSFVNQGRYRASPLFRLTRAQIIVPAVRMRYIDHLIARAGRVMSATRGVWNRLRPNDKRDDLQSNDIPVSISTMQSRYNRGQRATGILLRQDVTPLHEQDVTPLHGM